MQPFDALTVRAVLQEAKPLLLNRKVDKVYQLARDEIVLTMRSKAGMINLLLSAQTAYGRLCLVKWPQSGMDTPVKGGGQGSPAQSGFSTLLRKHLTGATLIAVEQPLGERMVDFVFSCTDEVGTPSIKILTAEIMGRHSNLIFWDKASSKIVCASHIVTKEMSRQREVAPGLPFERAPGQDKPNIFSVQESDFESRLQPLFDSAIANGGQPSPNQTPTVEQWLISAFTGLGRHLAEELVSACQIDPQSVKAVQDPQLKEKLWRKVSELQSTGNFKPAMRNDLSRYTVLSWWPGMTENSDWKTFPAVNDLIEEYYRAVEVREQFNQLKDRLRAELKGESDKLESRIVSASQHLVEEHNLEKLKRSGDLILANLHGITSGQQEFTCENLYGDKTSPITIKLNPNLSPSQNAQSFYRQFAKTRARQSAASIACREANQRLAVIRQHLDRVEQAKGTEELRQLKDLLIGRRPHEALKSQQQAPRKKPKNKLLTMTSSDGWTIYVGRNRQENDHLLSRMAQPNDIWLHIQGQGGAHVLVRVPASKQEPPLNTIKEAAQAAARLSKAASGTKVRVVYTQCRYVKKISKDKPGLVKYENEKTIEVDTGAPMPKCMKQLFQQ